MTGPLILAPDLEAWCTSTARAGLQGRAEPYAAGVHVDIRVPNPLPDRLVVFTDDGGPRLNPGLVRHRIRVRTFATTEQDATALANLVAGILEQAAGADPVTHVSVNDPVDAAEPTPARLAWLDVTAHTTIITA